MAKESAWWKYAGPGGSVTGTLPADGRPRPEHQRLGAADQPRAGGHTITLTHGEWLDPDGDVTTDHLRPAVPFLPEPLPAGQVD